MTHRRAPASPYAVGYKLSPPEILQVADGCMVYSRRYNCNAKVHNHYPQGINQPERFMLDRGDHLPSVSRFVIVETADIAIAKP
jgi:hypothetical protein